VFGAVPGDVEHIFELQQLLNHVVESVILVDQEPDATAVSLSYRHAQDAFDVKGAPGEQAAHV
jgi:hypothetical protein